MRNKSSCLVVCTVDVDLAQHIDLALIYHVDIYVVRFHSDCVATPTEPSEERSQKKLADTQFAHPRAYSLSYLLVIDGKYFMRTMHQCC